MFPWESSISVNNPASGQNTFRPALSFLSLSPVYSPNWLNWRHQEGNRMTPSSSLITLAVRLKAVADQDQSNRTHYCLLGILGPPGRQPYCCELFQTSKIKSRRYSKTVCPHIHQTVEQDGLHAVLIVTVSQHVDPKEKKETRSVVDLMQPSCP